MMRQLRYRDVECRFPGCGARRFTQAHHIVWWKEGGPTDLDNLVLVCFFHHKLVHELGGRYFANEMARSSGASPTATPISLSLRRRRDASQGALSYRWDRRHLRDSLRSVRPPWRSRPERVEPLVGSVRDGGRRAPEDRGPR